MMETTILLLMILCHIIDDFVLQPICLSNLKQKEWWIRHVNGKKYLLYKHDYKMALLIHSMSWSVMILLPIMLLTQTPQILLLTAFLVNTLIHYTIDDLKANKGSINLITDQGIHLAQVLLTWFALVAIL